MPARFPSALLLAALLGAGGGGIRAGEPVTPGKKPVKRVVWKALEKKGYIFTDPKSGKYSRVEEYLKLLAAAVEKQPLLPPSGQMRGRLDRAGLSALALLTYLGAGYTQRAGRFRDKVSRLAESLAKVQKKDGRFSDDLADHALACLAMSENWGMTRTHGQEQARKALAFLVSQQLSDGGFPARSGGKKADDLATVFAALALRSAQVCDVGTTKRKFPKLLTDEQRKKLIASVTKWLRARPDKKTGRVIGPDGKLDAAVTAGVAMALLLMGAKRDDAQVKQMMRVLLANLPSEDKPDFLYWHFGQMACFFVGGETWKKWNVACKKALLDHVYVRAEGSDADTVKEVRKRIPGIIKRMGADDFKTREAASREAGQLPMAAVGLLVRHLKHKDAEVAQRVRRALDHLLTLKCSDLYYLSISTLTMEVYYRYLPIYSK